ncbi:protein translocase subunit SecF [Clostridium sediminicola]|uniref:protein translocase subunit SecF n=1 Tax=Clostridium sediminicola TaxID=3114879 RepID=UPI0031F2212F
MLKIVERTKIWFSISLLVIAIGVIFSFVNGFNFGIDFNGGTVVSIELGEKISIEDKAKIDKIIVKYDEVATSNTANNTQIEIKSSAMDQNIASEMFNEIKDEFNLKDDALIKQENVGPSIGKELKQKALMALVIATFAMLVYIAIRFELNFGLAAIVALTHDVLITLSVYTIFGIPINTPFIAAMLTILGYSINDTIVIFDRIRENKKSMKGKEVAEIANSSVNQTLSRSINTTVTTLFTIVAVYVLVPAVRDFTFPLIIGVLSGSYSSIFIASPVWVLLNNKKKK